MTAILLAGCSSSWNPVNWFGSDAPKPEKLALPEPTADRSPDLSKGLSADRGQTYAERGGRADVTVVRPLRTDTPPKVAVGSAAPKPVESAPMPAPAPMPVPAPQPAPAAAAQPGDLPGPVPVTPGASHPAKPAAESGIQDLATFSPENYGLTFLAATVEYAHGSAALSASDMQVLRAVAAEHKKVGGVITVVGHASSRTGDMSEVSHKLTNFEMSLRRAQQVAAALNRMGVAGRALFVGAVSDNEPSAPEAMPSGEARNRRTEIFLNY